MESNIKAKKSVYWQIIRGICILAVIMIHCPTGQEYSVVDTYVWLVLRQLINFPVAVFIFMAGYFVNADRVKQNARNYFINRGGRLLIPYLVWSSVYLLKDFLLNGNVSLKHIVYAYCTGKAATPFYYIVVMIQLMFLTPWLLKLKKKKWLYAVTPAYLLVLYLYNVATGNMPRLYETFFPAWFSFYILGMDCKAGMWGNSVKKLPQYLTGLALGVSIGEAFLLLGIGCSIGFASSQIRFGSFLYAAVIVLALLCRKNVDSKEHKLKKLLASIGDYSYGIFYVHMLVLLVVRKIVGHTVMSQVWILNFLTCFIITAIGSYVVVMITKQFAMKIGRKRWLMWFGFI